MQLQPCRIALALKNITLCFGASCAKTRVLLRLPGEIAHIGKWQNDQNFLYTETEAGARTGTQVEWMRDDWIEDSKSGTLMCLRLPAPLGILLWATRHYLHAYLNCVPYL